jgi:hypothetical protein
VNPTFVIKGAEPSRFDQLITEALSDDGSKGKKKRAKAEARDLARQMALEPATSDRDVSRLRRIVKGERKVQKLSRVKKGSDPTLQGAIATTLLDKLAALEELRAAGNAQAFAQRMAVGAGIGRPVASPRPQVRSVLDHSYQRFAPNPAQTETEGQTRIREAQRAVKRAEKHADPAALSTAHEALTLARLRDAHARGLI